MFPASLGDASLIWFNWLHAGQIDNFRELAEQFTARFITNIRVVKSPIVLTNLKKQKNETLHEYSSRYLETSQETEDCDLTFALNTFMYRLPRDKSSIYNSLMRYVRVNECVMVDDDEMATSGVVDERRGGDGNGKFDKSKRKIN